jgi:hypothetical protein
MIGRYFTVVVVTPIGWDWAMSDSRLAVCLRGAIAWQCVCAVRLRGSVSARCDCVVWHGSGAGTVLLHLSEAVAAWRCSEADWRRD